jgi:hypothetical protein
MCREKMYLRVTRDRFPISDFRIGKGPRVLVALSLFWTLLPPQHQAQSALHHHQPPYPTPISYSVAIMSSTTTVTETPTLVTVNEQPAITAENVLRLFPEVNTDLIGGSHNSATNDNALDGYDEEQIRLDEVCIVLDNDDIPIGSATKKLCECCLYPSAKEMVC